MITLKWTIPYKISPEWVEAKPKVLKGMVVALRLPRNMWSRYGTATRIHPPIEYCESDRWLI